MKKITSIFMAMLMLVAVFATSTSAFAKPIHSLESTTSDVKIEITVNGANSIHGTFEDVSDDHQGNYEIVIDFEYSGNSTVIRWEIPDLIEGVDYIILKNENNVLTIAILKDTITDVKVNVVTKDGVEELSQHTNKDKTSPDTGAFSAGMGIAFVGVGASLLALRRKNK